MTPQGLFMLAIYGVYWIAIIGCGIWLGSALTAKKARR